MVEPTALRLLIPVLPIRTLHGEWHFTIANSISNVLLLPTLPMVIRRSITPKGWYVSPEKPTNGDLYFLNLDRMLYQGTARKVRSSVKPDLSPS
ncbi:hypothetical protein Tco_0847540 [Tanacetum coccineum]